MLSVGHVALAVGIAARGKDAAAAGDAQGMVGTGGDRNHIGPILHIALAKGIASGEHHRDFTISGLFPKTECLEFPIVEQRIV